jgi:transposase-like protein
MFPFMWSRWKQDKPMSRTEFDRKFPDDAACARHLVTTRWPDGFTCPECGSVKGWELSCKRFTWECAGCSRQTSVTAGTVMHRSKIGLRKWFELAHMMTSHSNGVSAEQAQAQLGLGSWNTAWLMLTKLRRAMVDPARSKLAGTVEVDETTIPFRTKREPPAGGQGRSPVGKIAIVCAVELSPDGEPRRIRMEKIPDYTQATLHRFIDRNVAPRSVVRTDGNPSYEGLADHRHDPHVIGKMAAHVVLKWVHRAISNMKRWLMGTFHGGRRPHLNRYLDEFVWRWNRRRSFAAAFDGLLGIAVTLRHASRQDFVAQLA